MHKEQGQILLHAEGFDSGLLHIIRKINTIAGPFALPVKQTGGGEGDVSERGRGYTVAREMIQPGWHGYSGLNKSNNWLTERRCEDAAAAAACL